MDELSALQTASERLEDEASELLAALPRGVLDGSLPLDEMEVEGAAVSLAASLGAGGGGDGAQRRAARRRRRRTASASNAALFEASSESENDASGSASDVGPQSPAELTFKRGRAASVSVCRERWTKGT